MPRPDQIAELAALRAQRVAADAALADAVHGVERARRTRDAVVTAAGGPNAVGQARAELAAASESYRAARSARNDLLQAVLAQSRAAAGARDDDASAALFGSLEGDTPVLLFPVRLETRYVRDANQQPILKVRIYPDAANVQRHLEALTAAEQQAGRNYWRARFDALRPRVVDEAAPDFEADERYRMRQQRAQALWAEMVKALKSPRAAYVVQRCKPDNAALLQQANPPFVEPVFSQPDEDASRLAAQPVAAMLPDRYCAVGLAQGGRVVFRCFGEPVPDVLTAAPVIHPGDAEALADDAPPADPFAGESSWLANFDDALALGMAITVTQQDVDAYRDRHPGTPVFSLAQTLERLVVLGIDWTLTPDEAAAGVAALLESQAASAGMGFVATGTPTNNTAAAASGHSPAQLRDPSEADPSPPAPGTSAAEALRFALGLPDDSFTRVNLPGAALDDGALAGHMANALYAGTIGGYLRVNWSDADSPLKIPESVHEALRAHVVSYLRPLGPLQPLRIDTQPYGMLPVIASGRYQADAGFEAGLFGLLQLLRPSWRDAIAKVPRFDGDPARSAALLEHGPWAQSLAYREIERDPTASAIQTEVAKFQQQLKTIEGGLYLQAIGVTWGGAQAQPRMLATLQHVQAVINPEPSRLPKSTPWVQADAQVKTREADWNAALSPDYIGEILNVAAVNAADLRGAFAKMRNASSLLHGLLAWSVDREAEIGNAVLVDQAAGAVVQGNVSALLRTPRSVGVEQMVAADSGSSSFSFSVAHGGELAALKVPAVNGDDTVGMHVARQAVAAHLAEKPSYGAWYQEPNRFAHDEWRVRLPHPARHLASVLTSLAELRTRTVGELNWALRSTLDVFDHRLDAWYTSLATRRLAQLRVGGNGQRRTGVHVGAWGFVEQLRPDPVGTRESRGHMLMPSLRHAAAAAVLRSGYENGDAVEREAFALDLSSQRVRAARDIFEGLAQGQPLAVLLGYRFERELRDTLRGDGSNLAEHILSYRQRYPLKVSARGAGGEPLVPTEAIAARDVVDGASLLDEAAGAVAAVVPVADRALVSGVLAELAQLWDAVADVSVVESVYQVTQGNMERAAAALAVLDKQTQPVEPQSVLSPREGISYTQRVAWLFDATAPAPAGWPEDAIARAEPRANAWLAELIGDPGRFVLRATVVEGDVIEQIQAHAAELGISPLALALALGAPGGARTDTRVGGADDELQELSRLRLIVAETLLARVPQNFSAAARVRIEETSGDPAQPGLLQLEALLGLAQRLLQSRVATRRDLAVIEPRFDRGNAEGDYPGVDAGELAARAGAAADALAELAGRIDAALAAEQVDVLRLALREARPHAVLGAEADLRPAADPVRAVLDRAASASADLAARAARLAELRAVFDDGAARTGARVQAAIDALKCVFGKSLPVLPLFTMGDAAAAVQASLDAQPLLTAGQPAAVAAWLPKIAKVREGVERLQSLLLAREMLVAPLATDRHVVLQSTLKVAAGAPAPWEQPWLALPQAWPAGPQAQLLGQSHRRPDLALALLRPAGLVQVAADTPLVGLVCDDWAETVPLHHATAAVAFHFDAPGARPPQTLLLAVPPQRAMASWSFEALLDTIDETIALARLRAVGPALIEGAANLALPLNVISDSRRPDVAGLNLKFLAGEALKAASAGALSSVLAINKV